MPTCRAYLPGRTQPAPRVTAAFAPGHGLAGSSSSLSLARVMSALPGAGALPAVPSRETINSLSRVRRPLASPTCPTRSTGDVYSAKRLHLCPATTGTNPSPLAPAPRCRGSDRVHPVPLQVGIHPTQVGTSNPSLSLRLSPAGDMGLSFHSWLSTSAVGQARWWHWVSVCPCGLSPTLCPGGPAPGLGPWQRAQGSPLAS